MRKLLRPYELDWLTDLAERLEKFPPGRIFELYPTLCKSLLSRLDRVPIEPFIRASGDVECPECGDLYRRHAHDMKQLDSSGQPFLRVLCHGQRVKL